MTHGDVHEPQVRLCSQVRQPAGRIERRPHDGDRVRQHLYAPLANRRGPRGLWLRRSRLRSREESPTDVVGHLAVERLIGAIEPELPSRGGEDEIHFQTLLDARAPVLEIDRPRVLEHLLPFLRCGRVPGDVAAAVEVRQLAIANDLKCLERHQAVTPAERVGGLRHADPALESRPAHAFQS